jgi:ribonuclease HI
MSTNSSVYLVFTDSIIHHTQNLAFIAWVVCSPEGQLVPSNGVFLGPSMNNVNEYSGVIEILCDVVSHGINYLEFRMDSQLVVCQLIGSYRVQDPFLLQRFLRVRILEQSFYFITYNHIPRSSNYVSDAYDNYVLDWNFPNN